MGDELGRLRRVKMAKVFPISYENMVERIGFGFVLCKLKKQERDLKVPVMVKCSRTCRIEGDMGEVFGRKQYLVMRSRVGHR